MVLNGVELGCIWGEWGDPGMTQGCTGGDYLCGSSLGQHHLVEGSFRLGGWQGSLPMARAGGDLLGPWGAPL